MKTSPFVHDRMPVILNPDTWEAWIDPDNNAQEALQLIPKNRGADLVAYRVGTAVYKNTAQGSELIEPLAE
ncbi:SOS response-associated peptidase family protein [Hoeflea sp.]|uniref:SOS response-associated peptidase family protein n=1 Tax=Hoeflea sp. TaxID=1940281 RepID=UPI003B023084